MRNAVAHSRKPVAPRHHCAKCVKPAPFTAPNGQHLCGEHFDAYFEGK